MWQKREILTITSNCQNYHFLYRICPLFCLMSCSHFKRTIVLHFNGCFNSWERANPLLKSLVCAHEVWVFMSVYIVINIYVFKINMFFLIKFSQLRYNSSKFEELTHNCTRNLYRFWNCSQLKLRAISKSIQITHAIIR